MQNWLCTFVIADLRPPSMLKAQVQMPRFHFSINCCWFQDLRSPLASGMLLRSWPSDLFSLWSGPRQNWIALMGIYKPFRNTLLLTSVCLSSIYLTFAFLFFFFLSFATKCSLDIAQAPLTLLRISSCFSHKGKARRTGNAPTLVCCFNLTTVST